MKIRKKLFVFTATFVVFLFIQCSSVSKLKPRESKILFLHHSTGGVIFNGGVNKTTGDTINISTWIKQYNRENNTAHEITEQAFPKSKPYGWRNYPYDYYNIWVKNSGNEPFMEEPTLEILTQQYDMIIFKHCFPVSNILEDLDAPDINSDKKTTENYKLQYNALKKKLAEFPDTKFLVWTGAALTELNTSPENAARARTFFQWVKNEWDEAGDNIFVWDFFELETEGGNYLKNEYAVSSDNSHPNKNFARYVVPKFGQRIVDVIENNGSKTTLMGDLK